MGELNPDMIPARHRRLLTHFPPRSTVGRYGFATACVALVTLGVGVAFALIGPFHPFLLFVPAVLLGAWYGGRGPGALGTGLAACAVLLLEMLSVPPAARSVDRTGVVVFVLVGLTISFAVEIWHEDVRRVEEQVRIFSEALGRRQALVGGLPGQGIFTLLPNGRIHQWEESSKR